MTTNVPRRSTLRPAALVAALGATACATLSSHGTGPVPVRLTEGLGPADVTWVATSGPEGDDGLQGWRVGVGPAVLQRAPGVETTVATQGATQPLVLVTWNVHVGGGDLIGFVRDLRAGGLTGAPVEDFVLLLQEVQRGGLARPTAGATIPARVYGRPPTGPRLGVLEVARRLGLHVFYAPSMGNGRGPGGGVAAEDRGNAILSTLPLHEPVALELPYEAQRRVAVVATVRGRTGTGAAWEVRVASAHLDTRARWSRVLDSFGAARTRQARALVQALDPEVGVLGADLNTWGPGFLEGAPEVLRARFPDAPGPGGPTFVAGGVLPLRLDHLLFRLPAARALLVRTVESRYGSDHYPVLGEVWLGEPAERATASRSSSSARSSYHSMSPSAVAAE